jgi:hypothetical protein
MNLPTPPTDSLYKFLALGSLAAALALQFWMTSRADSVGEQIYAAELETAITVIEADANLAKAKFLVKEVRQGRIAGFWNKLDAQQKLQKAVAIRNAQNKIRGHRLDQLVKAFKSDKRLARFGTGTFALLSLVGFLLWYFKVQRYQDELLRLQLLAARSAPKEDVHS